MAADGTDLAQVATSPAQDGWPAWTPDGAALIFASTRSDRAQLYRADLRSGEVRRLLDSPTADTEPAVAPGGAIAFSAQSGDGTGVIALLVAGEAAPRRLPGSGGLDTAPNWSPDGARLAFAGQRGGRSDVYVVDADGRGLARLTATGQNQRPNWGPAPAASLTTPIAAQNGSGQSGTATLTDLGDGTTLVAVSLANPSAVPQPLHLHAGTCATLGASVAYPLTSLVGGVSETVVSVPLVALLTAPHAINAHRSPQEAAVTVACGEIARRPG
jgi:dipeptidyl aminopeptidase/acylaminoacyl peptidase